MQDTIENLEYVTLAELQALFSLVGSKMSILIKDTDKKGIIKIYVIVKKDYEHYYKALLDRMRDD